MSRTSDTSALLQREAKPLASLDDVDAIVDDIGEAGTVLLGEASHGTDEFYRLRAAITRRLITERGFDAVAIEADWPDALRISRYLHGHPQVRDIEQALGAFVRFPRWMWRNEAVRDFVQWLKGHDAARPLGQHVGLYGLDLYSLRSSMQGVIRFLESTDPELARRARERYDCFDRYASDPQRYGASVVYMGDEGCEQQAIEQMQALMADAARLLEADGPHAGDELFYAQQNARVVVGAEHYYRAMFRGGVQSWNLRDTHMADTLDALREHLSKERGRPAKVVVWAHNSHIGDARATEMSRRGECNLGQLVRERAADPRQVYLLGFTTHEGSVAASSDWDEPVELKAVRPSRPGSLEHLLHEAGLQRAFVPLRGRLTDAMGLRCLERAIGVIYRPDTELASHYFETRPSRQFDGLVHIDRTRAVTPLDPSTLWQASSAEETWPSGL